MGASKNEKQRHLAGSVCIACNSWFPGCEFKYNVGGRDNFKKKKGKGKAASKIFYNTIHIKTQVPRFWMNF